MLTSPSSDTQAALAATSRDGSIAVLVGHGGACLGVRLSAAAMRLGEAALANRIMLLSTWGQLRVQLALRTALAARHAQVSDGLASVDKVAQFETLIDF